MADKRLKLVLMGILISSCPLVVSVYKMGGNIMFYSFGPIYYAFILLGPDGRLRTWDMATLAQVPWHVFGPEGYVTLSLVFATFSLMLAGLVARLRGRELLGRLMFYAAMPTGIALLASSVPPSIITGSVLPIPIATILSGLMLRALFRPGEEGGAGLGHRGVLASNG